MYNNNISIYLGKDFDEYKVYLTNYTSKNGTTYGVRQLLQTDNLPYLTSGNYPIIAQYKLPGKSMITSKKQIIIEYKQ